MSSAEAPPPVSRDVRLAGGGIELRPLEVDHAAALDEAVRESATELMGTVPWWQPDATVADQEAWARFTRDAWAEGSLYAFVVLGGDGARGVLAGGGRPAAVVGESELLGACRRGGPRDPDLPAPAGRDSTRGRFEEEGSGRVLHVGVLALGVVDVQRAARFWCAALDYEPRTDGFGGWATVLVPRSGSGLKIALQRSETAPQDHPRLHLDLHAADAAEQAAEADRLVTLGARRIDWDSYPDDPDFVVLADTEGNRFCIVDLSHNRR